MVGSTLPNKYQDVIMVEIKQVQALIGYSLDDVTTEVLSYLAREYIKSSNADTLIRINTIVQNIIRAIDTINQLFQEHGVDIDEIQQYFSILMGDINYAVGELQQAALVLMQRDEDRQVIFTFSLCAWQLGTAFGCVLYGDCEGVIDHLNWTSMAAFGKTFNLDRTA